MLRVYKRFGGMRDLAFIRGYICDSVELKPEAAGGNFNYERGQDIVFYGVGIRNSQGEQTGIQDFN